MTFPYMKNMPFIPDKTLFKAVCYARRLRYEENLSIELAMGRAAKYYKVNISEVAKYMGKFAANCLHGYTGKDANFDID